MVDETTGERYKVTFEHVGIYSQTWVPAEKEHISRRQAVDQFRQLKEWEASGEEPIRNVHLFHATVEWREIEPDQAQALRPVENSDV